MQDNIGGLMEGENNMTDPKLEVSVGAQDIVHITIGGELSADKVPLFKEWTPKVNETIKNLSQKKGDKVLCLVDIASLTQYDPQILVELATLMKSNEPYVLRSATFGGSTYMVMAEDIVIALSGRKNLKAFKTKEEALDWLVHGDNN
jgi:hypothetical protein